MVKSDISAYSQYDLQILQDAIFNLESVIPQQDSARNKIKDAASHKGLKKYKEHQIGGNSNSCEEFLFGPGGLVTQKQLVDSLEQVLSQNKQFQKDGKGLDECSLSSRDHNHLYRLILKVHSLFLNRFNIKLLQQHFLSSFKLDAQIQEMVDVLTEEKININKNLGARQTYRRCLLQKSFLSLLENLAGDLSKRSSQQHLLNIKVQRGYQDQMEKDANQKPFTFINSKTDLNDNSLKQTFTEEPIVTQRGDGKDIEEKGDKEDSPVRRFLDQKYEINADSQSLLKKAPDIRIRIEDQENYKLMLKCLNIWKVFSKQQQLKRMQEMANKKERERKEREDYMSELELSREMGSMSQQVAVAISHYWTVLEQKVFQVLIQNIFESHQTVARIRKELGILKKNRLKLSVFREWRGLAERQQRRLEIISQTQRNRQIRLFTAFIDQIKLDITTDDYNLRVFQLRQNTKVKRRLFNCLRLKVRAKFILKRLVDDKIIAKDTRLKQIVFQQLKANSQDDRFDNLGLILSKFKIKRLRPFIVNWKRLVHKQGRNRIIGFKLKERRAKMTKMEMMFIWMGLAQSHSKATNFRRTYLLKKVMNSLNRFIRIQDQIQNFVAKIKCKFSHSTLREVVKRWRMYTRSQKSFREFQLGVFEKMDRVRLKSFFKGWFNRVDVLKRWRFLTQHTNLWYQTNKKKLVFKAWRKQIDLKFSFFQAQDAYHQSLMRRMIRMMICAAKRVKIFKLIRQKRRVKILNNSLMAWHSKVPRSVLERFIFENKMKRKTLRLYFNPLKKNWEQRRVFKRGMKQLLNRRALNLKRIAFLGGLKQVWHEKVITRSLIEASLYFNKLSLLRKGLKSLRKRQLLRRNEGQLYKRHLKLESERRLRAWWRMYIRRDTQTRMEKRRSERNKRKVIDGLKGILVQSRILKLKSTQFIQTQSLRVVGECLRGLQEVSRKGREKKGRWVRLEEQVHKRYLKHGCMQALLVNKIHQRRKKVFNIKATAFKTHHLLRPSFDSLWSNSHRRKAERHLVSRRQFATKYKGFYSLARYAASRVKSRLFQNKKRLKELRRVVDGLIRNKVYRQYFRDKERELLRVRERGLSQRVIRSLTYHLALSRFYANSVLLIQQKRCYRYLDQWRQLTQEIRDESGERRLADLFFQRIYLIRLQKGCRMGMKDKNLKMSLGKRQAQFYNFNQKRRALKQLYLFMSVSHLNNIKTDYANKIQLRRVFIGWRNALEVLKRKNILLKSADLNRNNSLLEKSMHSLKWYAQTRIRNNLIIDRMTERWELATKAEVLLELINNVQFQKDRRTIFSTKILYSAQLRVSQPFQIWREFVADSRLIQKADLYFKSRPAQILYRVVMDRLILYKLESKSKKQKLFAVTQWHHRVIKQKTLVGMRSQIQQNRLLSGAEQIVRKMRESTLMRDCLESLRFRTEERKEWREMKQRGRKFYSQLLMRKVLYSLITDNFHSQAQIQLKKSDKTRLIRQCLTQWKLLAEKKIRLNRMLDLFQEQNDRRMLRSFFPKLVRDTYHKQIVSHLGLKRESNLKIAFFTTLRRQVLLKDLVKAYREEKEMVVARNVLGVLRCRVGERVKLESAIWEQTAMIEEESRHELQQIAFNALKERLLIRKFKIISVNCFRLKTMRKVFSALHHYELKCKIDRGKVAEVRKIQEAKYFSIWRFLFIREKEKRHAQEFIQSTQLLQIVRGWSRWARMQILARSFNRDIARINFQTVCFNGWRWAIEHEKEIKAARLRVEQMHKARVGREVVLDWWELTHQAKTMRQMAQLDVLKIQKRVFSSWNEIKKRNNLKRKHLFRIREQLKQRPELGRPLRAMLNRLLFKAFNQLRFAAPLIHKEDCDSRTSRVKYYMTLTKKAFYSLRLSQQYKDQAAKALLIQSFFLKRRWLGYLKQAVQSRRERKRWRHRALIFRLIVMQKKALTALRYNSLKGRDMELVGI